MDTDDQKQTFEKEKEPFGFSKESQSIGSAVQNKAKRKIASFSILS